MLRTVTSTGNPLLRNCFFFHAAPPFKCRSALSAYVSIIKAFIFAILILMSAMKNLNFLFSPLFSFSLLFSLSLSLSHTSPSHTLFIICYLIFVSAYFISYLLVFALIISIYFYSVSVYNYCHMHLRETCPRAPK